MAKTAYERTDMDWRDRDDLTDTEQQMMEMLDDGRCTPAYIAEELDRSQEYIRERLRELKRLGLVKQVHRGLYEIENEQE